MKGVRILRNGRIPGGSRNGLLRLVGANSEAASMPDIQTTNPVDDVFGNVGGVVRDAFEVPRGKNELHARAHGGGFLSHMLEQLFEKPVAVLIDDIVAFENLGGHLNVAEHERAETLADHDAH